MTDDVKGLLSSLEVIEKKLDTCVSKQDMDDLGKKQVELARALADIQQKGLKTPEPPADMSYGAQFVKSAEFNEVAHGGATKASVLVSMDTKSALDPMLSSNAITAGTIPAYRKPGVVGGVFRPLTIESLFTSIGITSDRYEFVRETEFVNGAAATKEGEKAGLSSVKFDTSSGNIVDVPHIARISQRLMQDGPALAAYINLRMIYGVDIAVENELVNGEGGDNHLNGLFKTGNFVPHNAKLADLGGAAAMPNLFDLMLHARSVVTGATHRPNVILINDSDWTKLLMLKNKNGDYLLGSPTSPLTTSIWGMSLMPSPSIKAGQFMVLDTFMAGIFYERAGIELGLYEQDQDNVSRGLVTLRATRRVGFGLERPSALCGGALTVPAE